MARLLRVTALLMGGLLLMLTVTEALLRLRPPVAQVPLVTQPGKTRDSRRLVQVWPGIPRPLPISQGYQRGLLFWGVDATGESAYFETMVEKSLLVDFYRVRRAAPLVELVAADTYVDVLKIAPDYRWIMTGEFADGQRWEFVATHLDTRRRWSLSQLVAPWEIAYGPGHLFSQDSQWLYLTVRAPDYPRYEIIGVRLADGALLPVTDGRLEADTLQLQEQVGDWLIVRIHTRLYRVRRDGMGLGPLFDWSVEPEEPYLPDYVFAILRGEGIVLVSHRNSVIAVDVAAGKALWEHTDLTIGTNVAERTGWTFVRYQGEAMRLHVPSGELQPLPLELQHQGRHRLAADPEDRWVPFAVPTMRRGDYDWFLYEWNTASTRLLRAGMGGFLVRGISPDGQWLILENERSPYGLYRLRLSDGLLERLLAGQHFEVVGWMKPLVRQWQAVPLLLVGGALLGMAWTAGGVGQARVDASE